MRTGAKTSHGVEMPDDMSLLGVLAECVKAAGGSKVVGPRLWPEMLIEQAQRKLLDCLNDDRPHRLTPDQVLLVAQLARAAGCHAFMAHVAHRLHYDTPVPREPRDEAAELQRAFVLAVQQQQQNLDRMQVLAGPEAVGLANALRAVR